MELLDLKVLYIEDDDMTRDSLTYYLKKRVRDIYPAATGEAALQSYETYNPDILIVDLLLPDISGIEVIKTIRKRNARCRILVTSSLDDTETILSSVEAGIDDYIVKPIDPAVLMKKLNDMAKTYEQLIKPSEQIILASEDKVKAEMAIRNSFIKLLKQSSGRGPRDANISWLGDKLVIMAYDTQTPMEKTLRKDIKNDAFIKQFRALFYESLQRDIREIIESHTAMKCCLDSMSIDIQRQNDKLVYKMLPVG